MSYQKMDVTDFPGYSSRASVPAGTLVQSGGGISNMHHGNPQGIYSYSSHQYGLFGNSMPKTDKTYGNMYGVGPSYLENNYVPQQTNRLNYEFTTPRRENFEMDETKATTSIEDYEVIAKEPTKISPYIAFIIFVILFVAIFYWTRASDSFLKKYLFKDKQPEYWHFVILAVVLTIIFFASAYLSGISVKYFETL